MRTGLTAGPIGGSIKRTEERRGRGDEAAEGAWTPAAPEHCGRGSGRGGYFHQPGRGLGQLSRQGGPGVHSLRSRKRSRSPVPRRLCREGEEGAGARASSARGRPLRDQQRRRGGLPRARSRALPRVSALSGWGAPGQHRSRRALGGTAPAPANPCCPLHRDPAAGRGHRHAALESGVPRNCVPGGPGVRIRGRGATDRGRPGWPSGRRRATRRLGRRGLGIGGLGFRGPRRSDVRVS